MSVESAFVIASLSKQFTATLVLRAVDHGAIDLDLPVSEYLPGIQRLDEDGVVELSHNGYLPGFISTMLYYPQTQTSVIVLENVSWDTEDLDRVFLVHDAIRDAVRRSSLVSPH